MEVGRSGRASGQDSGTSWIKVNPTQLFEQMDHPVIPRLLTHTFLYLYKRWRARLHAGLGEQLPLVVVRAGLRGRRLPVRLGHPLPRRGQDHPEEGGRQGEAVPHGTEGLNQRTHPLWWRNCNCAPNSQPPGMTKVVLGWSQMQILSHDPWFFLTLKTTFIVISGWELVAKLQFHLHRAWPPLVRVQTLRREESRKTWSQGCYVPNVPRSIPKSANEKAWALLSFICAGPADVPSRFQNCWTIIWVLWLFLVYEHCPTELGLEVQLICTGFLTRSTVGQPYTHRICQFKLVCECGWFS